MHDHANDRPIEPFFSREELLEQRCDLLWEIAPDLTKCLHPT